MTTPWQARPVSGPGARDGSFERLYLEYVAVSEGCGCAERLIQERRPVAAGDGLHEILAALGSRLAAIGRHTRMLRSRR